MAGNTHKKRQKANWIGNIWRRNCLLKHVVEGKLKGRMEVTVRRGRRHKQLPHDRKKTTGYWKFKRGSTRSHSVDKSLWKRLWACCNTDYGTNEHEA